MKYLVDYLCILPHLNVLRKVRRYQKGQPEAVNQRTSDNTIVKG